MNRMKLPIPNANIINAPFQIDVLSKISHIIVPIKIKSHANNIKGNIIM